MSKYIALIFCLASFLMLASCTTPSAENVTQCSTPQTSEFILSKPVALAIQNTFNSEDPSFVSDLINECGDRLVGYDRATAYEVRGVYRARQGDEVEAIKDFWRALELNALPEHREEEIRGNIEDISRVKKDCYPFTHCDQPVDIMKRVWPNFPSECASEMSALEVVQLSYDVNPSGIPTNIRPIDVTNDCFLDASIAALKKWRYSTSLENGMPVWRRSLVTSFSFARE